MGHGYLTAQVVSPQPDSLETIGATLFPNSDSAGIDQERTITEIQEVTAVILEDMAVRLPETLTELYLLMKGADA